jgi:hypothetical protein
MLVPACCWQRSRLFGIEVRAQQCCIDACMSRSDVMPYCCCVELCQATVLLCGVMSCHAVPVRLLRCSTSYVCRDWLLAHELVVSVPLNAAAYFAELLRTVLKG